MKKTSFGVRSPWAIEKSLIPNWGPGAKSEIGTRFDTILHNI